jgi:hypothetical protein
MVDNRLLRDMPSMGGKSMTIQNIKAVLFGCHSGWTFDKWGRFDHSKLLDQLRWNFFQNVEGFMDIPRTIRFRLANTFSKWAHRLRGGKSYDFGYGIREDRAAHLASGLRFRFIPPPTGMDADEANEALDEIEELEQLAHGTTWVE